MPQSIGILGGTFDPVHNGHLRIAEAALIQLQLDLVLFIPNARSPLKSSGPMASFNDRMAMLRLAIDDRPRIGVADIEGVRGGISYTIDTLRALSELYPDASFYLILGADSLQDFHLWREHAEILERVRLASIERHGFPISSRKFDVIRIEMLPMDVSSTAIRDRVQRLMPIDHLVPPPVAGYIAANRLYVSQA